MVAMSRTTDTREKRCNFEFQRITCTILKDKRMLNTVNRVGSSSPFLEKWHGCAEFKSLAAGSAIGCRTDIAVGGRGTRRNPSQVGFDMDSHTQAHRFWRHEIG